MAKTLKTKKKQSGVGSRRKERRFSTSANFVPGWVALLGIVGSFVLGAGIFGMLILDPALSWASSLVAVGGCGLGIALWLGQPSETAVLVGDAGIGVEDGQEITRVPWYLMRSLSISNGNVMIEGEGHKIKFLLGANPRGASYALKEAAERVPNIVDVDQSVTGSLPDPGKVGGYVQDVADDQVAGARCAHSDKLIQLEEDARLCSKCGQIYHKDALPEACGSCEAELKGRTLLA